MRKCCNKGRVEGFKKVCTGHFMFEPVFEWIAYSYWNETICSARTKKECIQKARECGYSVTKYSLM